MTQPSEWKWYGMAGHFICAPWCRFHLCTDLGNGYYVSTVGDYHSVPSIRKNGGNTKAEQIGWRRLYETMVFRVHHHCAGANCGCGAPLGNGSDLEVDSYNTAQQAQEGHLALCKKWSVMEPEDAHKAAEPGAAEGAE